MHVLHVISILVHIWSKFLTKIFLHDDDMMYSIFVRVMYKHVNLSG